MLPAYSTTGVRMIRERIPTSATRSRTGIIANKKAIVLIFAPVRALRFARLMLVPFNVAKPPAAVGDHLWSSTPLRGVRLG
jgi:hypothetical protein